ncbi:UNVERIFIED_ORG: hypothetical protein ABIB19_002745 [Arthrobacter sp. UYEF10]
MVLDRHYSAAPERGELLQEFAGRIEPATEVRDSFGLEALIGLYESRKVVQIPLHGFKVGAHPLQEPLR